MNTFKNDRSQGLDQGLILAYPFKKRTLPMVWRYNKAQVTSESLWTQVLVVQGWTEGIRTKGLRIWPSPGVTTPKPTMHEALTGHRLRPAQLLRVSSCPSCSSLSTVIKAIMEGSRCFCSFSLLNWRNLLFYFPSKLSWHVLENSNSI